MDLILVASSFGQGIALYPPEDRNRIINRDEAGNMGLTMTQGVAAELGFKLQNRRPCEEPPEPIDLTGGKVSSNVYDPAKMKTEVAVQAVSPEGKVYVGTIVGQ